MERAVKAEAEVKVKVEVKTTPCSAAAEQSPPSQGGEMKILHTARPLAVGMNAGNIFEPNYKSHSVRREFDY
ncbi:MAG: hypothetical protein MUP53_02780 [Bacteroidales bacterium]|nr:hypothetical protein [Bacteroidales bacterium]